MLIYYQSQSGPKLIGTLIRVRYSLSVLKVPKTPKPGKIITGLGQVAPEAPVVAGYVPGRSSYLT